MEYRQDVVSVPLSPRPKVNNMDITITFECSCGHEFDYVVQNDEIDYTPHQDAVKNINSPRLCPEVQEEADYVGPDTAACPKCGEEIALNKEKIEEKYLEVIHE